MSGFGTELETETLDVLRPFIGKNPEQIESILKEHLNPNSKSYFRTLADRMLKTAPEINYELVKQGISVRAVRIKKDSIPKESMSLPVFRFDEIAEQNWEDSDLRRQLSARFLFLVFQMSDDESSMVFANASFWTMPEEDLRRISIVWEDTKAKVLEGRYDSFIPKAANMLAHIRPHAQSASDTYLYKGVECKKYSFWLNNDYIGSVIAGFHKLSSEAQNVQKPGNLEEAIVQELSKRDGPMIPFSLKRSLDPILLETENYDEVVNSLIRRNILERTPDGLRLRRCKLGDMIEAAPDMVRDYFSLDEKSFRQKYPDYEKTLLAVQSYFAIRPEEDSLGADFSKYRLNARLYQDLYGIDETTYRYLELMHPKGWMDPEQLLNDPTKTDTFKRKLRSNLFNTVEIGEMRIGVDDESIITYVVSRYTAPKTIADISRLCKEFVAKNGLKNAPLCRMNGGDIKNYADKEGTRLLRIDSKRVRYYPYGEKEVVQFLKELDLERYMNMYVSTQLLIDDSKGLCKKMDVADEQELFMLMSKYKTSAPMKDSKATLSTSPSICFGTATVGNQIERLLQETGRIDKNAFLKLYSERYGMKEQSIRAIMSGYTQYSNGSYYDMNLPEFSDDVIEYLRGQFSTPLVSTEAAIERFEKAETRFNLGALTKDSKSNNDPYFNASNLKRLGYKGGQGSIFIDKYSDIRECIEDEYLKKDFIQLDDDLKGNPSFMRIFGDCLESGRFYPIGGDQYISYEKLKKAGVTRDLMIDYVEHAAMRFEDNDYFTLEYLRNTGFEHPLEDKGFDDEFYENILMKSGILRNRDIDKHKVFTKSEKFNRNEAVVSIVVKTLGSEDSDYADLLSDRIQSLYGLNLHSELKKEHKPLRYCKYTEKIYRDDETYINEIKGIQ